MEFCDLPEAALVKVMTYLPLHDRSITACTCHTLNEIFHHPSLWYNAEIKLLSGGSRYTASRSLILPDKYVTWIKKFGKYFQKLSLKFEGYPNHMSEEVEDILQALGEQCRLEVLTLSVGVILSKYEHWVRPKNVQINKLLILIQGAFRLHTVNILAWPYDKKINAPDILLTLRENQKLHDVLENLNLFWQSAEDQTWSCINPLLPSPEETLKTVEQFSKLHTLKLQSKMMSNALIEELGKPHRTKLEMLNILVTYSSHQVDGKLPAIQCEAWQQLRKTTPRLLIDVTIVNRIPYIELSGFLQPEMPVSGICFMKYSDCRGLDVHSIGDKYAATLQRFYDYSDNTSSRIDEILIEMVMKCENLTSFIYNGELQCETVTHLAKLRCSKWHKFQINSDNVTFINPLDTDSDQILIQKPDGSYEIASHLQRLADNDPVEKEAKTEVMIHEVAEYLGKKWLPMNWTDRQEEMMQKIYS